MSRLNLTDKAPEVHTLDELIPNYALNKSELDSYKKICDDENAQIKALMTEHSCDEYTVGGYTAKKVIQHKESMNEEKLLAVLKQYNIGCIKTVEVVDMDSLEAYLYKNTDNIPSGLAEKLAACKVVTEVVQLRIAKAKTPKGE